MGCRFPLFTALTALALAGCGGEPAADTTADEQSPVITRGAADAAGLPAAPAMPSQEFAAAMASGGLYEVEAAKVAQASSEDEGVEAFAETMITDHTKAAAELAAAAARTAPPVTLATEMTADQQAKIAALRAAGGDFDEVYKSQMESGHAEMLAMIRAYAGGGASEPLKEWATETAPIVSIHQSKLRALGE